MKTLTLLLLEFDSDTIEFVGIFPTEGDAVQYVWNERKGQPVTMRGAGFVANRDNPSEDVVLHENMMSIDLRPLTDFKKFAGLGATAYKRVWLQQGHLEGEDPFILATFEAVEKVDNWKTHRCGDLRYEPHGHYTHLLSSKGQMIEEKLQQDALRPTAPSHTERAFLCDKCAAIPRGKRLPLDCKACAEFNPEMRKQ